MSKHSFKTQLLNVLRTIFLYRPFEEWLRRRVKGKASSSFWGKWVPNNYQYPKQSIREFDYYGVQLSVDISDYVGHALYYQFEDVGQDYLLSLASKGNRVLDIGTNLGSTLLRFAQIVGTEGAVIGFEPDPINYKNCELNISLNAFKNLKVFKMGLGDQNATMNLVVDTASNRGGNRISTNQKKKGEMVEVKRLDEVMASIDWTAIDLIKIDVEGYDLKVLKGGAKTIKRHQPKLFIELDNNNLTAVGDSASSLILFLKKELGYDRIHNVETKKMLSPDDDFENCHFDIIAEKQELL